MPGGQGPHRQAARRVQGETIDIHLVPCIQPRSPTHFISGTKKIFPLLYALSGLFPLHFLHFFLSSSPSFFSCSARPQEVCGDKNAIGHEQFCKMFATDSFKSANFAASAEQLEMLFKAFDTSQDGLLELPEIIVGMVRLTADDKVRRFTALLAQCPMSSLSSYFLYSPPPPLPSPRLARPQDVKEETKLGMIFDAYDDDHSGTLEMDELVKFMTGRPTHFFSLLPYVPSLCLCCVWNFGGSD